MSPSSATGPPSRRAQQAANPSRSTDIFNSDELRCFDFDFEGKWANFRGFDMIAVAVSGYVDAEGAVDAPIMPLQVIFADYVADADRHTRHQARIRAQHATAGLFVARVEGLSALR